MTRPKPSYHHGNLRNALFEEAVKLVEQAGVENFSLREAARLVGVSANAAYRHFADKSELLAAVAEFGFGLLERRLLAAISAVSDQPTAAAAAIERIRAAGRAYVDFAVEHPELLRVMFGSSGLATLEKDSSLQPAPFVLLSNALDALVREEVLPADRRAGAELKAWTVVHGFASLVILAGGADQRRAKRAADLETLLDFAMVGLCGRLD
ncbi:MAG: TetR/AcrR family transcriptional regulator [Bradyrhizobium sp.]|uniref:TetR/AcrR family transcriptional regulator n=1 Tax=Bradyrhizobium sp. TaxID=376 RepID=UPI0025BFDC5D|nr:TetR/AcrR family transcriptional regulator [Bradyrhizobium sp.]MBI5263149.1 TetR/AcrR family transcriptional regulator [Bradyrhizobium sp.]